MTLDVKALKHAAGHRIEIGSDYSETDQRTLLALIALLEQQHRALEDKEYDQPAGRPYQRDWCGICGAMTGEAHIGDCSCGAALAAGRAAGLEDK